MQSDADSITPGLLKRSSTLNSYGPNVQTGGGRGIRRAIANIANFSGTGNDGLQIGQNMGFINYHTSQVMNTRETVPTTVYDVPDRLSAHFVGRMDELSQIKSVLHSVDAESPARCIIFGMPGLGKSMLALKYADDEFKANRYSHVFWISAASSDKLSLGLSKLLDLVAFPGRETLDQNGRRIGARTWLEDKSSESSRRWLLILDNVTPDVLGDLQDNLPRSNGKGRILMTCRTKRTAESLAMAYGNTFPTIGLGGLDSSESVQLLLHNSKWVAGQLTSHDQNQAEHLIRSVGYLPLAIDQAASILTATGSTIAELVEVYNSEAIENALAWENDLSRYEEKSIMTIYSLAIAELERSPKGCKGLVKILAFLDPEEIPLHILTESAYSTRSKLDNSQDLEDTLVLLRSPINLAAALQYLEKLSLVMQLTAKNGARLKIHDLVQQILRVALLKDADERKGWFLRTTHAVYSAVEKLQGPLNPQTWEQYEPFVPHVKTLLDYGKKHKILDVQLSNACTAVILYLELKCQYGAAENMNRSLIASQSEVLGPECEPVIDNMCLLMINLVNQGRYAEAEAIGMQASELVQRNIEVDNETRLSIMVNLSIVFTCQGRIFEAERLEIEALNLAERELDQRDPLVLLVMERLAYTYLSLGRYKEAEDLQHQILEKVKDSVGTETLQYLTSLSALAGTCRAQGRWIEAEKLYLDVDGGLRELLEDDHVLRLVNAMYLAYVYLNDDKVKEAEILETDTLKLMKKKLGQDHPRTLECMLFMTMIYQHQNRLFKAKELGERLLVSNRRIFGHEHPNTLVLMNILVFIYVERGEMQQAEELALQAVDSCRRILGEVHPDTLTSMAALATCYHRQQNLAEAEKWYVPVLDGYAHVFGAGSAAHQNAAKTLASIYRDLGLDSKAMEVEAQIEGAAEQTPEPKLPEPLRLEAGTALYEDDPAMESLVNCLTSDLFSPSTTVAGYLDFIESPEQT